MSRPRATYAVCNCISGFRPNCPMVYLAVNCVFNGEDRHARGPLSLVPSLSLDSSDEYINDMLKWERDSNALNPLEVK